MHIDSHNYPLAKALVFLHYSIQHKKQPQVIIDCIWMKENKEDLLHLQEYWWLLRECNDSNKLKSREKGCKLYAVIRIGKQKESVSYHENISTADSSPSAQLFAMAWTGTKTCRNVSNVCRVDTKSM